MYLSVAEGDFKVNNGAWDAECRGGEQGRKEEGGRELRPRRRGNLLISTQSIRPSVRPRPSLPSLVMGERDGGKDLFMPGRL